MTLAFVFSGYLEHIPEKRWQSIILFAVLLLQYAAEHLFPAAIKYNDRKNEGRNLLIGVVNLAILFFPSVLIIELLSAMEKNKMGFLQQFIFPFWLKLAITIFIMDLAMYWWHRINHTQKIFWRFHQFHHKDNKMNTTTALRFHTVELLFSTVFKALFFLLMGFSFLPILIYETLFFIIVLIHHSNINISRNFDYLYRKLFSSPLMHRIHHSDKKEETDTNYGSVFSFWDRLFMTYKKEASGEIVFGVKK